jgi:hypothetical protein
MPFVILTFACVCWFGSLGANLTPTAVKSIMEGNVENPETGIQLHEFQQLVYIVYQIKS